MESTFQSEKDPLKLFSNLTNKSTENMGKEADSPQDGVKTPKEEEETPEPRAPPILEKEVDLTTDPTPASEDPEPEMTSRETDMIETWAETDLTEMT